MKKIITNIKQFFHEITAKYFVSKTVYSHFKDIHHFEVYYLRVTDNGFEWRLDPNNATAIGFFSSCIMLNMLKRHIAIKGVEYSIVDSEDAFLIVSSTKK